MKLFQTLLAITGALFLAGCEAQPAQALLATPANTGPALWQVTSKANPKAKAYLFGAIHLLPPETRWQSPTLDRAVQSSDSLTIELIVPDDKVELSKLFSAIAVQPGLPPISERIDPKLKPQLDAIVAATSAKRAELNRLKTWAAALQIIPLVGADIGLSPAYGVDAILQHRFAADDKPVFALETMAQQFSYFNGLPEADQRKLLNAVLKSAKGQRRQAEKLLQAWLNGNQTALRREAESGIIASPNLREVLLDRRNRRWAAQIGTWIDQSERRFIAVGAGHLAGPKGVPALLAAKGYTVTRLQ